jgi:hypothetical protein
LEGVQIEISTPAHQHTTTSARQLVSSSARQLVKLIASFLAIASMTVFQAGCRDALSAATEDPTVARTSKVGNSETGQILEARLRDGLKNVEKRFKNTSVRAKYKFQSETFDKSSGKSTIEVRDLHEIVMFGDTHMAWSQTLVTPDKDSKSKPGTELLNVTNSEYAFILEKPKDGKYSLLGVQRHGVSQADDVEIKRRRIDPCGAMMSAYHFYGWPVWKLIRDDGFKINKIESLNRKNVGELVIVDFTYTPPQSKTGLGIRDFKIEDGVLSFSPDRDWQLVSFNRGKVSNTPVSVNTVSEYPPDQLAIGDETIMTFPDFDDKSNTKFLRIESTYGAVAKEHFYLRRYGFPEPNFGSTVRWPWILGGLVLGAICIFASRRLLRR